MGRRYRRQASGKFAGSAVAAGIALAVLSGHHGGNAGAGAGHGTHAATAAIVRGTVSGGTLSCSGLEALWESAGGSRAAAFTAAEIAMAESGGRQDATLVNANGTTDRGYWQINSVHGALSTYGAAGNARAAVAISADGADWSPWVTWQTGAYAGKC
jgi:Lysozyme like domain